jgi:hypothetical protein
MSFKGKKLRNKKLKATCSSNPGYSPVRSETSIVSPHRHWQYDPSVETTASSTVLSSSSYHQNQGEKPILICTKGKGKVFPLQA